MFVALVAAITMAVTDVLGVVMVMAESRDRGWLAGWMDTAQWLVGITTTTITVTALQGHNTTEKILVVALVSAANLLGTKLGQIVGKRFVTDATTLADRVARLESLSILIDPPKGTP